VVCQVDNLQLARIARLAGAPKVQGAGVDLLRKLGDPVQAGQALYRVHAAFPADLSFAQAACDAASGVLVGHPDDVTTQQLEL
jgi:thymidine phosphorylase